MLTADAVVVGAGVVGLSVAYHLAAGGAGKVLILEKEAGAGWGETSWCTGGIRHQFSSAVHVELTRMSLPFFQHLDEETGVISEFSQTGYLFLAAGDSAWHTLREAAELQRSLQVPVELLDSEKIKDLFSELRTEDLLGGTFCALDAQISPAAVVEGWLRLLRRYRRAQVLFDEPVKGIAEEKGGTLLVESKRDRVSAPVVVNAAGPWAAEIASMLQTELPVSVHPRQVMVLKKLEELNRPLPLTVDMDSGWYLHRSGGGELLTGGADKDAPPGWDRNVDWEKVRRVLEAGAHRLPLLEKAEVARAYVGLRSMSPDGCGILGGIPEKPGFYAACGFSGHGFMHSPAIGRLLAEIILEGKPRGGLDIGLLSPERFGKESKQEERCLF